MKIIIERGENGWILKTPIEDERGLPTGERAVLVFADPSEARSTHEQTSSHESRACRAASLAELLYEAFDDCWQTKREPGLRLSLHARGHETEETP